MSAPDNNNHCTTEEEDNFIEEEWEFNAPKYFDFDRLTPSTYSSTDAANNNNNSSCANNHHHDEELNHSNADQWFFTSEAQHLEFLDPKYIDLNNQDAPQQQPMMMNNCETLNDISTISKYSVHQEETSSVVMVGSTHRHHQQQHFGDFSTHSTLGTIHAFNSIRMTPVKKIKKKVFAAPKLTIPQTPNFKTDKRIRQRKDQQQQHAAGGSNNVSTTTTTNLKGGKMNLKVVKSSRPSTDLKTLEKVEDRANNVTKFKPVIRPKMSTPKPFKFRTDSRVHDTDRSTAAIAAGHSPFNKSILQKINDLRSQVPSRWKQKPDQMTMVTTTPYKPMKITKPSSFKLRTKHRSRTNTTIVQQAIPPVPTTFKARPLNRKIFDSHGELGLSKIIKKDITHPQEFSFMTEERSKKRKFDQSKLEDTTTTTFSQQQPENRPFKARKLDANILSGSYIVQTSKIITKATSTIPQSPKLRTKSRPTNNSNRSVLQEATPNSPHITFRARPLPATQSNPFVPRISHTITVPEPFSLQTETRGIVHKKQLDSKLVLEMNEKENVFKGFKARPIHHYTNVNTSKIVHKPVTLPVSPNITKVRSKRDDSILSAIGPKLPMVFKARPMPDFNNTSCLNKTKNLEMPSFTRSEPFDLQTEKRGQVYQSKFREAIKSIERVSISKIDNGTFTSITKRVNTSIQQIR